MTKFRSSEEFPILSDDGVLSYSRSLDIQYVYTLRQPSVETRPAP